MTFRWWERWGAATGILSVALFIVAVILEGSGPGDKTGKILSYYAKHSNQVRHVVGFFVFFACLLLLLAFLSVLRARLLAAEGEPGRLSALAFSAGVGTVILLMAANALGAVIAATVNTDKHFTLDANMARVFDGADYLAFTSGVMAAIALVVPTSVVALRSGIFPRWFAWIGFVVALTFVAAIIFIPAFILFGWILVASGLMLWWTPRGERMAGPAPPAA